MYSMLLKLRIHNSPTDVILLKYFIQMFILTNSEHLSFPQRTFAQHDHRATNTTEKRIIVREQNTQITLY